MAHHSTAHIDRKFTTPSGLKLSINFASVFYSQDRNLLCFLSDVVDYPPVAQPDAVESIVPNQFGSARWHGDFRQRVDRVNGPLLDIFGQMAHILDRRALNL